jgi:hypothetical protein
MPTQADADPLVYELPAETSASAGPAAFELPTDAPVSRLHPIPAVYEHPREILAARLSPIPVASKISKLSSNTPAIRTPAIRSNAARFVEPSAETCPAIQLAPGELFEPSTVAPVKAPPDTTRCPSWDQDATNGTRGEGTSNASLLPISTTPTPCAVPSAYPSTRPSVAAGRPTAKRKRENSLNITTADKPEDQGGPGYIHLHLPNNTGSTRISLDISSQSDCFAQHPAPTSAQPPPPTHVVQHLPPPTPPLPTHVVQHLPPPTFAQPPLPTQVVQHLTPTHVVQHLPPTHIVQPPQLNIAQHLSLAPMFQSAETQ